jgi:nitrous oxidase accessory protein NosD
MIAETRSDYPLVTSAHKQPLKLITHVMMVSSMTVQGQKNHYNVKLLKGYGVSIYPKIPSNIIQNNLRTQRDCIVEK